MNIRAYPGSLKIDCTAALGITNFGAWLDAALVQHRFFITGDWDAPALTISDVTVNEAYNWLSHGRRSEHGKADFIYEAVTNECSESRLALIFDCIETGDFMRLKREYITDLIKNGGHWQRLCEAVFGEDARADFRVDDEEVDRGARG